MALAASASDLGLQIGLNDVFHALSAKRPILALMKPSTSSFIDVVAELCTDPYVLPAEMGEKSLS